MSCFSPAASQKTAGLIEKETEVSYDLYGIRLRAKGKTIGELFVCDSVSSVCTFQD